MADEEKTATPTGSLLTPAAPAPATPAPSPSPFDPEAGKHSAPAEPEPDVDVEGEPADDKPGHNPDLVGSIEADRNQAETEELEAQVEYTPAVYTAPEATDLLGVATAVGLGVQDLVELSKLNDNIRVNGAVIKEGDEIILPRQYSYIDVDNVTGGDVKDE